MSTTALSIDNKIVLNEHILGGQPHLVNRGICVKDIAQGYDLLKMDADEIAQPMSWIWQMFLWHLPILT